MNEWGYDQKEDYLFVGKSFYRVGECQSVYEEVELIEFYSRIVFWEVCFFFNEVFDEIIDKSVE